MLALTLVFILWIGQRTIQSCWPQAHLLLPFGFYSVHFDEKGIEACITPAPLPISYVGQFATILTRQLHYAPLLEMRAPGRIRTYGALVKSQLL